MFNSNFQPGAQYILLKLKSKIQSMVLQYSIEIRIYALAIFNSNFQPRAQYILLKLKSKIQPGGRAERNLYY